MTRNSLASRASWLRSATSASPAPGYWTLTATSRPSRQTARCTWPMLAAAAGRVVELAEALPPARAELVGEHLVHGRRGQRRGRLLQLGQRRPVGAGDLLGQRRLEDRQRLAELHRAALELAEHAEQVLGGALLHLGGDDLGGQAGDPLAEPERGAPGEAQRQRREPGGPGDGPAGMSVTRSIETPDGVRTGLSWLEISVSDGLPLIDVQAVARRRRRRQPQRGMQVHCRRVRSRPG